MDLFGWFHRVIGNLGSRTAHHRGGDVQWSRLPQLHARIADRIPSHLYRKSSFDDVLADR